MAPATEIDASRKIARKFRCCLWHHLRMPSASSYSVIQFRPSQTREEGVNLGIVVAAQGRAAPEIRFASSNKRVHDSFPDLQFDDRQIEAAKVALAARLMAHGDFSEEGLCSFISVEAGQLVLSPPRQALLGDSFESTVETLFRALVVA